MTNASEVAWDYSFSFSCVHRGQDHTLQCWLPSVEVLRSLFLKPYDSRDYHHTGAQAQQKHPFKGRTRANVGVCRVRVSVGLGSRISAHLITFAAGPAWSIFQSSNTPEHRTETKHASCSCPAKRIACAQTIQLLNPDICMYVDK